MRFVKNFLICVMMMIGLSSCDSMLIVSDPYPDPYPYTFYYPNTYVYHTPVPHVHRYEPCVPPHKERKNNNRKHRRRN